MIRTLIKITVGLALVLGAGGGLALFGDWYINDYPPGRIWYRQAKAAHVWEYEQIHPQFLETNPADLIHVKTDEEITATRTAITQAIFGQGTVPLDLRPDQVSEQDPGRLADVAQTSYRLELSVDAGHRSIAEAFFPGKTAPDHIVLYHHGYAGTFWDAEHVLRALLAQGVGVIGFNQAGYGHNALPGYKHPRFGTYHHIPHAFMIISDDPMGYFFKPVTAALNWVTQDMGATRVDMVGLSNGGWQTAVQAAFDTRITVSVPVAGLYPLYLTWDHIEYTRPPEHFYRPLIHAANYLEMFVLATDQPHRRQAQVFNRYDKCCYMNTKGKLYEQAVVDAVHAIDGGDFSVTLDETHADHKISAYGVGVILEALGLQPDLSG